MISLHSSFKNNYGGTKVRALLVAVLMLLSFAALVIWRFMPIYPDEIAFSVQMGRYIPDHGVVHGLYALCTSNLKETPTLFIAPAWMLSWLDLTLSPVAMRSLPFLTILFAIFLAARYTARGTNPLATLILATAFIGVAGSGLVMARYEYVQELNVLCCLWIFLVLDTGPQKSSVRYGLCCLLILSCLLSLYAHIQGLLFLPLTIYLAYKIIFPEIGKPLALTLMLALFVLLAATELVFRRPSCAEFPEIVQFWKAMTFSPNQLATTGVMDWFLPKFDAYAQSFIYKARYAAHYLPGVGVSTIWESFLRHLINIGVAVVSLVNLFAAIFIAVRLPVVTIWRCGLQRENIRIWLSKELGSTQKLVPVLLALPVVFLFFYDNEQNFYRTFFLNFLAAIALSIHWSRIAFLRLRMFALTYFAVCSVMVLASLFANAAWFADRFRAAPGYEGPSLSLQKNWENIRDDVASLAQDCKMDLSKGKIVVDDMTYDSLKAYPTIYPITYLALQSSIVHMEMPEVIAKVRPNYAIAQCRIMESTKIGSQHQRGNLCCLNFRESVLK